MDGTSNLAFVDVNFSFFGVNNREVLLLLYRQSQPVELLLHHQIIQLERNRHALMIKM